MYKHPLSFKKLSKNLITLSKLGLGPISTSFIYWKCLFIWGFSESLPPADFRLDGLYTVLPHFHPRDCFQTKIGRSKKYILFKITFNFILVFLKELLGHCWALLCTLQYVLMKIKRFLCKYVNSCGVFFKGSDWGEGGGRGTKGCFLLYKN